MGVTCKKFSLLEHGDKLSAELLETLKSGILKSADALLKRYGKLPYFQPIDEFHWGSNSDVLLPWETSVQIA